MRSSRNRSRGFGFWEFAENPQRWCAGCETRKPVDDFAVDRSKPSGRKSVCKACDREKSREYYARVGRERYRARRLAG
jgi:hypothetical protein